MPCSGPRGVAFTMTGPFSSFDICCAYSKRPDAGVANIRFILLHIPLNRR